MSIHTERLAQYVIHRAISENQTVYFYNDQHIDKEVTDLIDIRTGELLDLVDDHKSARARGDVDESNTALNAIQKNETLRLLSAYLLDGGYSHD